MTKDELDKYLAHLPARHTRKTKPPVSSNSNNNNNNNNRVAQHDRPLLGLKGPRGLACKSVIDQTQQSPPDSRRHLTGRSRRDDNNEDESTVDLTRMMDLKLSMASPPRLEQAPTQNSHYTDNGTSEAHDTRDNCQSEPDNSLERVGYRQKNKDKSSTDDIIAPKSSNTNKSANQQPEEMPPIPTFSFGNAPKPEPEEMPPIPTFSFGNDNIPTFSFGNDTSCNNEEEDILNLAVGLRCGGCDKMISGMAITAAGHRWHADCFKCQHCHQDLEHVAFYEKDGLPYCALDYHELFTTRCQYCHTPIEEKSIHALGKYYHVGHFFCRECGKPFDEDSTFMEHDGHPYCEKDYLAKFAHKCKGCKEDISGNFLEALDGKWHLTCFVCVDCGKAFESNTFYVRNNLPFCEMHSRRIKRPT